MELGLKGGTSGWSGVWVILQELDSDLGMRIKRLGMGIAEEKSRVRDFCMFWWGRMSWVEEGCWSSSGEEETSA